MQSVQKKRVEGRSERSHTILLEHSKIPTLPYYYKHGHDDLLEGVAAAAANEASTLSGFGRKGVCRAHRVIVSLVSHGLGPSGTKHGHDSYLGYLEKLEVFH